MPLKHRLTTKLCAPILYLEGFLVFFVAIAAFGFRTLPAGAAFGGGAVLIAVFFVAGSLVRRVEWGVHLGWPLQAVLIALGVVAWPMYGLGVVFAALWVWCFVRGRRVDRAHSPTDSREGAAE